MSISSSLAIALSGLSAASRTAETISSNVANASTDGYGRRVTQQSSLSLGGQGAGVRIDGIYRDVDTSLLSDRRLADAAVGQNATLADFFETIEQAIGTPDLDSSLSARVTALETAFVDAANQPESDTLLQNVATSAATLAATFNQIADTLQQERMRADSAIDASVNTINRSLLQIDDLNNQILMMTSRGEDASGLMDQRQTLVDDVAEYIPLRVLERDHGAIALYSVGGATLLDGKAATLGFEPTGTIVAEMTIGTGALSGLTINGNSVSVSAQNGPISGGKLQALFTVRDTLAVSAQAELDAVAADFAVRLQDIGGDGTTNIPGLFTDGTSEFVPANETGFAARMSLSPLVDPDQGGAVWHLRSGLSAASDGDPGNSETLSLFVDALQAREAPATGRFAGAEHTAAGLSADLLSWVSAERLSAENDQSFAVAKQETLRAQELAQGVDTDQELQSLLLVEKAYAANAKVIQTADEMLRTLLGL